MTSLTECLALTQLAEFLVAALGYRALLLRAAIQPHMEQYCLMLPPVYRNSHLTDKWDWNKLKQLRLIVASQ